MPVKDTDPVLLEDAIASVRRQTYPHWQLCIADDASSAPHVRAIIERHAAEDERVRVTFREWAGHIAAASNSALDLAGGEFVLLLDHDDRLLPDALAAFAETISQHPEVDLLYSDEDKLTAEGQRVDPFFKPAWSPTLFTATNYVNHLVALRRSLVAEVGAFRDEMVGSQDYDLLLRVEERARQIAHIPRILYSWRMAPGSTALGSAAKPYAVAAARRALDDAVARRHLPAVVTDGHLNGQLVLRRTDTPHRPQSISLLVHGEGTAWQSLLRGPHPPIVDAIALDGAILPPGLATVATPNDLSGEAILVLAAAERPLTAESIDCLLEPLADDTVAAVGGLTLGPGSRVLQAGVAVAPSGQPVYTAAGLPALPMQPFFLNLKDLAREIAAPAPGCAAIRRAVWHDLGGVNPALPVPLAVVDLCLRALATGRSTVSAPRARFARATALPPLPPIAGHNWPWTTFADPFISPILNPASGDGLPLRCPATVAARVRSAGRSAATSATSPASG
jgi:glycosyltransferase involved in cell wall biosynthesis